MESQKLRVCFGRSLPFSCRDNLTQVRRELHFWYIPSTICICAHPMPSEACSPDQPSVAICTGSWPNPYFQLFWLMDWLFHASWHSGSVPSGRGLWAPNRFGCTGATWYWSTEPFTAPANRLLATSAAPEKPQAGNRTLRDPAGLSHFKESTVSLTHTAEIALLTWGTASF